MIRKRIPQKQEGRITQIIGKMVESRKTYQQASDRDTKRMEIMNQIAVVLDGLKQKISHGSTFVQRKYNEIGQAKFNLLEPMNA